MMRSVQGRYCAEGIIINKYILRYSLHYYYYLCSLIQFYGAFYREGTITIALEFMDGGSLANVLHQVGPIPEEVLAGMAFQVIIISL